MDSWSGRARRGTGDDALKPGGENAPTLSELAKLHWPLQAEALRDIDKHPLMGLFLAVYGGKKTLSRPSAAV
jgi:hypothetical protein